MEWMEWMASDGTHHIHTWRSPAASSSQQWPATASSGCIARTDTPAMHPPQVSMSFGSSYQYGFYPLAPAPSYHAEWTAAYARALAPLADAGVLAVAAAGNNALDIDNLVRLGWSYLPCAAGASNVVCVGATDVYDSPAGFSNRGEKSVHVGAPGVQIYSTLFSNATGGEGLVHTYGPLNGTSMAAPVVSGAAALALSLLGAADGNFYRAQQVWM
eukprot:365669-Chlamydomonas_euryale.AAC.5